MELPSQPAGLGSQLISPSRSFPSTWQRGSALLWFSIHLLAAVSNLWFPTHHFSHTHTHTHTHATGTTFRACADLGFACVGVELVEAHLDQTCVQGVPLTKPEEEPQALGYKRKRSEDVESPANFFGCKIHRGADNCRLAMQSPERAFGLEVLRQRWQIAKKAMAGTQVLRSDVLTTLNAPLSSEEVKGAPGALSKRKDNLLCPQNFWHDLALLALFTQKKSVRIAGKISHAVTFTC